MRESVSEGESATFLFFCSSLRLIFSSSSSSTSFSYCEKRTNTFVVINDLIVVEKVDEDNCCDFITNRYSKVKQFDLELLTFCLDFLLFLKVKVCVCL